MSSNIKEVEILIYLYCMFFVS